MLVSSINPVILLHFLYFVPSLVRLHAHNTTTLVVTSHFLEHFTFPNSHSLIPDFNESQCTCYQPVLVWPCMITLSCCSQLLQMLDFTGNTCPYVMILESIGTEVFPSLHHERACSPPPFLSVQRERYSIPRHPDFVDIRLDSGTN
jgi:hypothetical protein